MNMTRKEIYDHIWTRTVQGFADDYSLNYPILLRRIKEAGIPRPSRKEIRGLQPVISRIFEISGERYGVPSGPAGRSAR